MDTGKLGVVRESFRVNTLPRTIGVEQEIGDWKTIKRYPFHTLTFTEAHDGSVKPSGMEMVVAPMVGDRLVRGMVDLARGMYVSGAIVNDTCALHVHVGAEDFSYWDLRRLLWLYQGMEGEIYRYLVAPHRRENPEVTHYCQMLTGEHPVCRKCQRYEELYPNQLVEPEPIDVVLARMDQARSTSDLKTCFLRMLYHIEDPSIDPRNNQTRKGGRYEYARYFGLNLHSWFYRGTVEWRMKEATGDVEEVVLWPLWCGWVTHAATMVSEAEARKGLGIVEITKRYMPRFLYEWVKGRVK